MAPVPEPQQGDFLKLFQFRKDCSVLPRIHSLLGSILDCFVSMQGELHFLWDRKQSFLYPGMIFEGLQGLPVIMFLDNSHCI